MSYSISRPCLQSACGELLTPCDARADIQSSANPTMEIGFMAQRARLLSSWNIWSAALTTREFAS